MQTFITQDLLNTHEGQEANRILRSCVHCGFCTATCPTYRLLGDELDGPRGRIYLIKGMLEGKETTEKTRLHLDRCLTCRACETYCPSGVEYGHLLDIGRQQIEEKISRSFFDRSFRYLLRKILPYRNRFGFLLRCGQWVCPVLPRKLQKMIPQRSRSDHIRQDNYPRKVILFRGCVQPSLSPQTNHATTRVLNRLGIATLEINNEMCCGALDYHMAETESAISFIKRNIDLWWPKIDSGVEAIVTTASGCGVMVKDYAYILRNDPVYADKSRRVSALTKDISEIFSTEDIIKLKNLLKQEQLKPAFQNPCTLQHGQKLKDRTENILQQLGFRLCKVPESYLCCGSAGVYSLLQRSISHKLQRDKIKNLLTDKPDVIITANIGCQMHIQQATEVPVKHWIEFVDDALK
jgi:glycolate oxidase iron-sulfur subunit